MKVWIYLGFLALEIWLAWSAFGRAHEWTKVNDGWASDAFWLGVLWSLTALRNLKALAQSATDDQS